MSELPKSTLMEYVRNRVMRETAPRGEQTRLAKKVGVHQTYISSIVRKNASISHDLMGRLAEVWGLSWQELEAEATRWHEQKTPPRKPAHPEDYTNETRERAIQMGRAVGWSDTTIESLRNIVLAEDADPSTSWWVKLGEEIEHA